jgi:hypothetical protein
VLRSLSGLVEVSRGVALLAALALGLGDSRGRVFRDRVLRGGGREAAAGKLLIAEALLAEETIVLDKSRGDFETLTLAAVEVNGVGAGVRGGETSEVILNVKLEGKLKGGKSEVGEVSVVDHGLGLVDVGLHHDVVLLGSREARECGVLDAANAKVPGVANLVLGDDGSGDRRRRRREALHVASRKVVGAVDRVGARLEEDRSHGWGTSPVTAGKDLGENLLFAALLDSRVSRHHRVVEENTVGGCGHQATRGRAVGCAEAARGGQSRGGREVRVAVGVHGHHGRRALLEHDGGLVVVGVRRCVGCEHCVGDVCGLLGVLHLGASGLRTLLVDGLLVHHVLWV